MAEPDPQLLGEGMIVQDGIDKIASALVAVRGIPLTPERLVMRPWVTGHFLPAMRDAGVLVAEQATIDREFAAHRQHVEDLCVLLAEYATAAGHPVDVQTWENRALCRALVAEGEEPEGEGGEDGR